VESSTSVDYGLGKLLKEYRYRHWHVLSILMIVIGAILTVIGLGVLLIGINQDTLYLSVFCCGIGGLVLSGGVVFLLLSNHNRRRRVMLFESGFVHFVEDNAATYPWREINAVWQKIVIVIGVGVDRYSFTIQHKNGTLVNLNESILGIEELGIAIQENVSETMLPQVTEQFKNGETVRFGWLGLNNNGLLRQQDLIEWRNIEEISIRNAVITIKKEGQWRPWYQASVSEVPNLHLFLHLVRQKRDIHLKRW
jgi:hypothetical protein